VQASFKYTKDKNSVEAIQIEFEAHKDLRRFHKETDCTYLKFRANVFLWNIKKIEYFDQARSGEFKGDDDEESKDQLLTSIVVHCRFPVEDFFCYD
jgi:hypothetical protein